MKPEDVPKECEWNPKTEEWRHKKCGTVILGKEQIVSLHLPGTLAGFGETTKRIVPYCPKCESEPSGTGFADYGSEEDPDVQDMKIIKQMGERM